MRAKSIVLSLGAVAVVTGAIFALEPVAPVLSLGVLYLFAVLPVAALWGFPLAAFVSVVSMPGYDTSNSVWKLSAPTSAAAGVARTSPVTATATAHRRFLAYATAPRETVTRSQGPD